MRYRKILVVISIFAMVAIASGMIVSTLAMGEAQIWTDKPDYSPEEVVTIFGSGFLSDNTVWLNLTRPDGWVDSWTTLSDSYGNFTTLYQLDGIQGSYLVVATDGTNTATVTFTDAPKVSSVSVSPTSRTVSLGASAVYSISVTRGPGSDTFTATFSVISSSPSIPAGAISFSPATITCTPSCPGSTLTISTSSLPVGTYTFKVRAARSVGDFADSGTLTMIIDGSAPVITPTVTPSPNLNGWNKGDVTASWTVSDPESGIVSSTGCGTTGLNAETSGTTITCSATNGAGLSNSVSVIVRIDKTGPTISSSRSPGPNSNGWNNSPVTVSFTCSDALSGVASSSGPTTLSSIGLGQSVTGSCTDNAGNFVSSVVTGVNIDLTAPVISGSRSPSPNSYGWNNVDVTVTFTCSDALSGITTGPVTPQIISPEGSGQSRTATCVDRAGNSASATVGNVNIDKTQPSIIGSTSPGPNANGWNNVDVTVSFACSDSLSGVNSSSSPTTVSSEGSSQSVTGTCTDKAGNSASATVGGISIDKTNPTLSGSRFPGPNSYGWNNGPVTVSFDCIDVLSGVASSSTPTILAGEGFGQSITGNCTDSAGNSASYSVTGINIDLTSPTITGSRTPAPNAFGWNNADVTVSFACSDTLSDVAMGPMTPQIITTEGSAQSRTATCTDQADNSASATIGNINIDKTPPSITGSRSPGPNPYGWNNADVTVHFDCSDTLAGVDSLTPDQTVITEGAAQSVSGTCSDEAGNSSTTVVNDINIDKTVPSITVSRSPGPNAYGWNNVDVTISFVCSDTLSGIISSPSPTVVGEGASQAVTGTCTDMAGNSASTGLGGINVDETPPSITGLRSPLPNSFGWNNEDVTVSFTCSDTLSGVSTEPITPQVVSDEGAGQSRSATCADHADNTASATVGDIYIDKTAPVIVGSRTPGPNTNGWNNGPVTIDFSCSDTLSGVSTASPSQTIDTEILSLSLTGICTDLAGNTAQTTVGPISVDLTSPIILSSVTPSPNVNGWNNGPVTVHFDCADSFSGVESVTPDQILDSEGANQAALGTCTDLSGNSASNFIGNINIDLTLPVIGATRSPDANAFGWNNEPVTVSFTCQDSLSGVESVSNPTILSGEGMGQWATGTCVDYAGNMVSTSLGPINIDVTPPTITGSRSPSANSFGWNNSPVTVNFDCSDGLSGVDSVSPDSTISIEIVSLNLTGSCTDNAGTTAETTVGPISIDLTPPIIEGSRTPASNANDWNNRQVTVMFECVDTPSGVESISGPSILTSEGNTQSVTGACSDFAGNFVSATVGDINIDLTLPSITGSRDPGPNSNGWNNGLVMVGFTCSDSLSGVGEVTPNVTIDVEIIAMSLTGSCSDNAGNSATITVGPISIDMTAPYISGSKSPSPNANGWNNADVTVHFDCSDGLSGVDSVTPDQLVSTEAAGQSRDGTCVDLAGNSSSATVGGINIDKTPPSIVGSRTPSPNVNGWNNQDVTVHFECSDSLSGVSSVTGDQTVSTEAAGQSVSGTCTDNAGNSVSTSIGSGINIDKTAPNVIGSRTPSPNPYGWNNVAITVSFTCTDALSGTSFVTSPTILASEGLGQSVTGICMDRAGNSASTNVGNINIDVTQPTVTINTPNGGSYALNAVVPASWSVLDSLSGTNPSTVAATVPNGANIDTSTIGTKTFTVSGTDKAGNYVGRTVTYQVIYSQTCGRKILSPLEQVSSPTQLTRAYKRGSTLPIKFELCDANGNYLGTAIAAVHVYKISNNVDAGDELLVSDSGYSDSGSNVCRYDSTAHQYIYNLSTKQYSAGTYRLEVHLDDGTTITTYFQLAR